MWLSLSRLISSDLPSCISATFQQETVTYSSYKLDPKAYGLHGLQLQPYLSVPGRCTGDFFVQCDQTPDRENLRGEGCS